MEPIKQKYDIKARPEEVFDALLDPQIIQEWSGAPATMDGKVGGAFALFDGRITGVNVEIVKGRKLVQDWQYGGWKAPSKVTFTLSQQGETTTVDLLHEGVPAPDRETIESGWKERYLGKIQQYFEKGS